MLSNLTGWHVLVLLGALVAVALVVVVVVVLAIRLSRNNNRRPMTSSPNPVEQIQRLAQLRDEGLLSEAEFDAKRKEFLDRI